ncbi:MAG: sugar phosphate nucleotidyltransferase [Legionellaceae bacterium]|nr:sugar phosphate nucleotidyltransferase [Legionellaceae bacterium]
MMRAIILAGGKGTRLRPYTTLIPKPLVPIGGKYSILEIVLLQLAKSGFNHVTLAVNHLSHLIMSFFGDGSRFGIKLDYSLEKTELGTIGPLTLIKDLPENFLVMNGDILCNLDYRVFFETHVKNQNLVTVSAFTRQVKIDFGVLQYDHAGCLNAFEEKPAYDFDVSMGIYCMNRLVIKNLQPNLPYGFDDLMIDGLKTGQQTNIVPFSGYWLDIGRPDDYQYADDNFIKIFNQLGILEQLEQLEIAL